MVTTATKTKGKVLRFGPRQGARVTWRRSGVWRDERHMERLAPLFDLRLWFRRRHNTRGVALIEEARREAIAEYRQGPERDGAA